MLEIELVESPNENIGFAIARLVHGDGTEVLSEVAEIKDEVAP